MNIGVRMIPLLKLKQMGLYINTKHIMEIVHLTGNSQKHNSYKIYLTHPSLSGFNMPFFGYISSDPNKYVVNQADTPLDYAEVSEFIRNS